MNSEQEKAVERILQSPHARRAPSSYSLLSPCEHLYWLLLYTIHCTLYIVHCTLYYLILVTSTYCSYSFKAYFPVDLFEIVLLLVTLRDISLQHFYRILIWKFKNFQNLMVIPEYNKKCSNAS